MSKQPSMLRLIEKGLSVAQIAAQLKVSEGFVCEQRLRWANRPPSKPYGQKAEYARKALEMVLKRKEDEAARLEKSIASLRLEIEQMAYLEATGRALYQATKGARS